jgi:hypothetical protein
VLGAATTVVLKLSDTTGGVREGAAIGIGVTVLLAAEVVMAPATALEEAGATTAVELAGAAALVDEAGLEAPPPTEGAPVIVPKVRSWGVALVPEAISSGPGMGYESRGAWIENPRPGPVLE